MVTALLWLPVLSFCFSFLLQKLTVNIFCCSYMWCAPVSALRMDGQMPDYINQDSVGHDLVVLCDRILFIFVRF